MKWLDNLVKDFKKFNLPLYRSDDRLFGMRGAVGDYQEGRITMFNQGLFELSSTARQRLGTVLLRMCRFPLPPSKDPR